MLRTLAQKSVLRRLTFLLLVIVASAAFVAARGEQPDLAHADRESVRLYFVQEIRARGGEAAYTRFAEAIREIPVDRQHILAHVFGETLYSERGLSGFQACDLSFMYGCFHELMGRAITEKGLSVVPDVYDICLNTAEPRPFACLHGIGHGIIASLGYTGDELGTALETCDAIEGTELAYWCHSGVFMEYNQQSMLGTAYVRKSGEDVFEPCTDVAERYRRACIFEQVPWWHRTLFNGDSSPETFRKLGEYCESAHMPSVLVRTCFEGIGNITTPTVQYDVEKTNQLCEAASLNERNRLYCKSMAALSLGVAVRDVEAAKRICGNLTGDDFAFCTTYAHNKANMMHPLASPTP